MNRIYRIEKGWAPENSALKIKLLGAVQRPFLTGFWHLEQRISRVQDELKTAAKSIVAYANLNDRKGTK